jgi:hypothetical protein
MKIIKYTLLEDGTIPLYINDGGYFVKLNNNESPQDYNMLGLTNDESKIEEFNTKLELENYIKSFASDHTDLRGIVYLIQDEIDNFYAKRG